MKITIVFDQVLEGWQKVLPIQSPGSMFYLVPLTGDCTSVDRVRSFLQQAYPHSSVILQSTSQVVDDVVEEFCSKMNPWMESIRDLPLGKQKLHEIFCDSSGKFSAFWLTVIAERNQFKTNYILYLAQVMAVERILKDLESEQIIFMGLHDSCLKCLEKLCEQNRWKFKTVPRKMRRFCLAAQIGRAFLFYARFIVWWIYAKIVLSWEHKRSEKPVQQIVVSYFPFVDKAAAAEGCFKNKYTGILQESLVEWNVNPLWVLMYVSVDGYSFFDAVKLLRRLVREKGQDQLFLLEELMTLSGVFFVLKNYLMTLFNYWKFRKQIRRGPAESVFPEFTRPIYAEMVDESFCGTPLMSGQIFFQEFCCLLRKFPEAESLVYFCEMQIWENALNMAVRTHNERLRTIGYQHSAISRRYYHYFPDFSFRQMGGNFPAPKILAANGPVSLKLLKTTHHPRLRTLEALRYQHVARYHYDSTLREKKPTLLFAGSYNPIETRNTLMLLVRAFPRADGIQIWLKGHPSCDLEKIAEEMKLDLKACGYQIITGDMGSFLPRIWGMLVSTSSVAIEAVMAGCFVIVPLYADAIHSTPLLEFSDDYAKVFSPEDLKETVLRVFGETNEQRERERSERMNHYWSVDSDMLAWKEVLQVSQLGEEK